MTSGYAHTKIVDSLSVAGQSISACGATSTHPRTSGRPRMSEFLLQLRGRGRFGNRLFLDRFGHSEAISANLHEAPSARWPIQLRGLTGTDPMSRNGSRA